MVVLHHQTMNLKQFLSDEYGDLQDSHSATLCKLSKLGKDLSDIPAKVKEISDAVEVL